MQKREKCKHRKKKRKGRNKRKEKKKSRIEPTTRRGVREQKKTFSSHFFPKSHISQLD